MQKTGVQKYWSSQVIRGASVKIPKERISNTDEVRSKVGREVTQQTIKNSRENARRFLAEVNGKNRHGLLLRRL